jgi:L-fucose isomerase-like protein
MPIATLAIIVGNRDFFPDSLVTEGRQDILAVCKKLDIEPIILDEQATKLGAVETWDHVKVCASLFRKEADRIDGILITLPNFGDEKGIAETIQLAGLRVPILVQAYPDQTKQMGIAHRRDAFCGKISVCGNLRQYGFPFSLTTLHTVHPRTEAFETDLLRFAGVCRVVQGLRRARVGAIGSRPNAFNTVRFSEKLLQESGIAVQTVDLAELMGRARGLADTTEPVQAKLDALRGYTDTRAIPQAPLVAMAKLACVIDAWTTEYDLDATAVQCWPSMQQEYGITSCGIMSMLSQSLKPSACEMDITGAVSMLALQWASGHPSALADWNNNYKDDPDKCVLFHCGNWSTSFLPDSQMKTADILTTAMGEAITYGALAGRTPVGPLTFARIETEDTQGTIRAYTGEGHFTADPLDTFGCAAVIEVPGLQYLMKHICTQGFAHHVAISQSHTGEILAEAFETYLGWDLYYHAAHACDCEGCEGEEG